MFYMTKKQTNRSSNLLNFFLWAVKWSAFFYNSFWEFFCFVYVHTSCHDEIYLDEPKQIGLINSYLYCIFNDTVLQHTLAPTTCLLNVLGSYTGTYNKIHANKDNNSLWKAENKFPRQHNTDSDVHVVNRGLVKDIEKVIGRFDCVPFVCFKSSVLLCSKVCIHD